jgi:hypothetical protein
MRIKFLFKNCGKVNERAFSKARKQEKVLKIMKLLLFEMIKEKSMV